MKVKSIISIILTGVALLLISCTNAEIQVDKVDPQNKVALLEVYTNLDKFHDGNTKVGMASEDAIGATPWVLVFSGTGDDATFLEAKQATIVGAKSIVSLVPRSTPCRLLIVSNVTQGISQIGNMAQDFADVVNSIPLSTTFKSVVDNMLFAPPLGSFNTHFFVPYTNNDPLPMSAEHQMPMIASGMTIGTEASKLVLTRAVAKITVSSVASNFTLVAATALNVAMNCRLFQLPSSPLLDNTGYVTSYYRSLINIPLTDFAPATDNDTDANPLYIYETRKEDNTAVMIQTSRGYFKLAMVNASGAPIDMIRNIHYRLVITSVTGTGYATMDEALQAPFSSNQIKYNILLNEMNGYDIMDNGQYYLAVSNSGLLIYDSGARTNQLVCKVVTNAPVQQIYQATTNTAGIRVNTAHIQTGTTDLLVDVADTCSRGIIKLQIGNLVNNIYLTKMPSIPPIGMSSLFPIAGAPVGFIDGSFFGGGVTSGKDWISLSATSDPTTGTTLLETTNNSIYMHLGRNKGVDDTNEGEVMLTRKENGRFKVVVTRKPIIEVPIPGAFVGTFHRGSQIGERILKIDYTPSLAGTWTATILQGGEFINLDQTPRTLPLSDDAENNPVSTNQPNVGGVCSASSPIYFRVGMKGVNSSATPRYGLIMIQYNLDTNPHTHFIYVRQGEEPDYIMGPNEVSTPGSTMQIRPNARKFSPYNLTVRQQYVSGVPINKGYRGYGFTEYPSQTGLLFQFRGTEAFGIENYPIVPVTGKIGFFGYNLWETCPAGYSRPNDGSSTDYAPKVMAEGSEIRQSLLLKPQPVVSDNIRMGSYADGFYDREASAAGATVGSNYKIAAQGNLYYNPRTMASVFLPFYVSHSSLGTPTSRMSYGFYWTSTMSSSSSLIRAFFYKATSDDLYYPEDAGSIRCVKDEGLYTLSYNNNGGAGSAVPNIQISGGQLVQLADPVLTRSGTVFYGWNTREDGSGIDYEPGSAMTMPNSNVNLFAKFAPITQLKYVYVGAFWDYLDKGERVIRMKTALNDNLLDGDWRAKVVDGADFIQLDVQMPGRTYPLSGTAESPTIPVQANRIVRGTCTPGTGDVYFRVGLVSTLAAYDTPSRYGRIEVTVNNGKAAFYIYVRQGGQADYIGGPQGRTGVKWSPYNVGNKYRFTNFPSQPGQYYQWTNPSSGYSAIDPVGPAFQSNPIKTTTIERVCPDGYQIPTSITSWTGSFSNEAGYLSSSYVKSVYGYYADGFFDRQDLGGGPTPMVVEANTNNIAYWGKLLYNSSTNASIFMPAAGMREYSNGTITLGGGQSTFWSSTRGNTGSQSYLFLTEESATGYGEMPYQSALNVRCILTDPEYPPQHRGWAGSNVYWDGSKLTFDDVGVTTHEQYQGLFFQWGGLTAISPAGASGSATFQILSRNTWTFITAPYSSAAGLTTFSPPVAGRDQFIRAYLYVNEDQNAGLGDICKYITQKMGGPVPGKRWRLPTLREWIQLRESVGTRVGTFPSTDSFSSIHGQSPVSSGWRFENLEGKPYFPASGSRNSVSGTLTAPGAAGFYMSSTTTGPGSTFLGIINSANFNENMFPYGISMPVRCVVE